MADELHHDCISDPAFRAWLLVERLISGMQTATQANALMSWSSFLEKSLHMLGRHGRLFLGANEKVVQAIQMADMRQLE